MVKMDLAVLPLLDRSLILSLYLDILGGPLLTCSYKFTPGAYEIAAVVLAGGLLIAYRSEPMEELSIIRLKSK